MKAWQELNNAFQTMQMHVTDAEDAENKLGLPDGDVTGPAALLAELSGIFKSPFYKYHFSLLC